jgi:hypothetical protein
LGITGYATDATKNFVHTTRTQTKVAPKSDEVKIHTSTEIARCG